MNDRDHQPKKVAARLMACVFALWLIQAPAYAQLGPIDDVTDGVQGTVDDVEDTVEGVADDAADVAGEIGDTVDDAIDDTSDTAGDTVGETGDTVGDTVGGDEGDTIGDTSGEVGGKISDTGDETGDTAGDTIDGITDPAGTSDPTGGTDPGSIGGTGNAPTVESSTEANDPSGATSLDGGVVGGTGTDPFSGDPASDRISSGIEGSALERAGRALLDAAKPFTFPLILAVAVALFLAVQNRLDRRDPKLAVASLDRSDDFLSFS